VTPLKREFTDHTIPIQHWISVSANWTLAHLESVVRAVSYPVDNTLNGLVSAMNFLPPEAIVAIIAAVSFWAAGPWIALLSVATALLIGFMGFWDQTTVSMAMVFTAVAFSVVVGVPLGVLCSQSDRLYNRVIRPILDMMQTTPSFVYLVPIVILFGIGTGPGVVATIVFGLPPIVRLTNVGIRQVRADLVEAGEAFGGTTLQVLREVRLPLALPVIMAGVNQTVLLSVSMVVITSLIGAGGLGVPVLQGINSLDIGISGAGGLAIVLVAITLDRVTEGVGTRRLGRVSET
jgi:glycine betaine/proline transport system permease protein